MNVEVRVRRLDVPPERAAALLSTDERSRAARIVHADDRRAWVVARGALRELLAGLLDADPRALRFTGAKPRVEGSGLGFSLSHEGGLLVVATAWGAELGVDHETLRPLPGVEDPTSYFEAWTRREALFKAGGAGRVETFRPAAGVIAALALPGSATFSLAPRR